MRLPDRIEHYLHGRMVESKQPFCMRVAADHRLLERWGAAAAYGLDHLHPGDDVSSAVPFLDACDARDAVELPFITDAVGHSFHAHLIPDHNDCYVLYLDARKELDEKRRAQQAANEVKLLLERERRIIEELVDAKAELTVRRQAAEAESRRRGEYIATMSHEFKTPLMALLAHSERLFDEPQSSKESADAIRRIAQQQLWLVDNLLTGARLEHDGFAIHPQATDLRALVSDLCLVFAPLAATTELSFAAYLADSVPEFVLVDDLHLRQVLINLLGNAIKFTEAGSVALEMDYRDAKLLATVSDTGPGIAAGDQVKLFEAFQRGGEAPRKAGAGLGLSITRSLVEAMQGELRLDSAPGSGTRVMLEIAAAPVAALADDTAMSSTSILIAEDDPDICDLLGLKLSEVGYRVRVVHDGHAVIEAALSDRPGLIILDTNMPGLDGPTAARKLRESGFSAPILALSAAGRSHDIEFALASGCTAFLRKPAHPDALKRVVRELLLKDMSRSATLRD